MLNVETIRKIRLAYHRDKKSIRQIARDSRLSKNTVKKVLRSDATEFAYVRAAQPRPKLGAFEAQLDLFLEEDRLLPRKEQRSWLSLFEELQRMGFTGGYDSVRRYIGLWQESVKRREVKAFIPLSFDPGEAFQFDWSQEHVELGGTVMTVHVAHFRLCYSRMVFCVAYTRELLEMVLDAHNRAFEFFGGACRRGIYDNLKTVVIKILLGKARTFNKKFQSLASHYLFEPVACTPAAGWEKGQVENQVGFVRQRLFVPRLKFATLEELNRHLADGCRMLAARHCHPEFKERTVAELFEEEQKNLVSVRAPFDGFREDEVRISSTALVTFDRNRYSVHASAAGKAATVRAYADRVVVVEGGKVVGTHVRQFGREKTSYDPWHYVAALEFKPGALRNGAPFKGWELPEPLARVREIVGTRPDGDRQFVAILCSVSQYGLGKVAAACAAAITGGAVSRDVVLSLLARGEDAAPVEECEAPSTLPTLKWPPVADCGRYDLLLRGGHLAP